MKAIFIAIAFGSLANGYTAAGTFRIVRTEETKDIKGQLWQSNTKGH